LKNKEKFVLATKLLIDPSGKKMGKTEGNMIMLDERPGEIYGKVMSWPDEIVRVGFELCTDFSSEEIDNIHKKELSPRDLKAMLAKEIVKTCHDQRSADCAEEEFNRIFRENRLPTEIPEVEIASATMGILDLLIETKLASSKSEAKRLILQKGVKIDNNTEEDWQKNIEIKKGMIIRVGNRRFAKII